MPKNTSKNKRVFTKRAVIVILLFAMVATALFALSKAAGNASITLSPNNGSYVKDSTFSTSVYVNTGSETIATVDIKLTYDQSKLEFRSVSTTGSPFSFCTESSGGSGQISIVCSRIGGAVSGTQFAGKITFKALVGSGSTNVAIRSDSRLLKNDDTDTNIWNGNTNGGTYAFTMPVASTPPPSNGGSSTPNSSSSSGGTTTNPTTSISSTMSTSPQPNQSSNSQTPQSKPSATPGAINNQNGYRVDILVIDQDKKPVAGTQVSIGKQTVNSEDDGIAQLAGLLPGDYKVNVKHKNKNFENSIKVLALADTSKPQTFTIMIERPKFNYMLAVIPMVITVLIGGAIAGRTWLHKRAFEAKHFIKEKYNPAIYSPASQTTSIPYPKTNQPGTTVQPKSSNKP